MVILQGRSVWVVGLLAGWVSSVDTCLTFWTKPGNLLYTTEITSMHEREPNGRQMGGMALLGQIEPSLLLVRRLGLLMYM